MIVIRRIDPPPELQPRLLDAPPAPRECDVSSNGNHSRVPATTYTNIYYSGTLKPFCAFCGKELPEDVDSEIESNRRVAAIDNERKRSSRQRSVDRIRRRISQSSIASKRGRDGSEGRGLFDGIDG